MAWVRLADETEIPEGEGRAFEAGQRTIAIFRSEGKYYAIDDQCPHMGASLASGYLENCTVACPWHAWRFDIRDGSWCDNPRVKIDSYPVEARDGGLFVKIPDCES
ncbi:MAG: Rieske (2Fe-2S) protein [Planctomycetota bacterium]